MDFGQAEFRQHFNPPSFTINNSDNYPRRQDSLRSHHINMNGSDNFQGEEMAIDDMWTMPTSQPRPRPATIHEGFSFCVPSNYQSLVSWDSSSLSYQQAPSDAISRPISMHQDDCPTDNTSWSQKSYEESLDLQGLDSDSTFDTAYASDDLIPILDLYQDATPEGDAAPLSSAMDPRRMSGSSFTVSTSGGMSDMPSYEDFSTALSEAQSFSSDYPPTSNRNSLMSSTQLSPVTSPRIAPQTRTELVRTQSRGRGQASPSPRPGVRSAPYSVEGAKNKRWSTGSYGTMSNRKPSPFMYHPNPDVFNTQQRMSTRHSSPTTATVPLPLNYGNLQAVQQAPYMMVAPPLFQRNPMFLPSQMPPTVPSQVLSPELNNYGAPAPLLSHGLFRMLQSNADPHCLHGAYTDLSDPPDLYAALQEEQIPPPPEDMNPDDPDLVPHEQELRFEGDLYTPRWVRGHGNKREGWCGICKPGRWLVLKNSAFWYDKSFSHGISAATGSPFQEPQQKRRMDGSPEVWEGLCGSCNDWVPLVSSKKKGTTWFRHAYKCHTHPKVKDVPKRRRESSHARALAASTMAKPRIEPQPPVTPQMTPASMSLSDTPTPAKMSLSSYYYSQQQSTPVHPSTQSLSLSPQKLQAQSNTISNMI